MRFTLKEIADITRGKIVGDDTQIVGISTDTRNLKAGQLFIALIGEFFDPHELIDNMQADEAAAMLVQRDVKTTKSYVVVKDCYQALQELSAAWRARFKIPIVGITGSNGKTSVKELIKQILTAHITASDGEVLATQGNLNNHIGVPLTLCKLSDKHRFAVIEMGANHAGEIANLTKLAKPDIGVITNIGPAHLEGFGSIEGVARAKAEIYANLHSDGVVIVNADDVFSDSWEDEIGGRMRITFGVEKPADVSGKQITNDMVEVITPMGKFRVAPQVTGEHALLNMLAGVAVGLALGIDLEDIKTGIENTQAVSGRLMYVEGLAGSKIIDDSYNANPASLAAALSVQSKQPGEHWLVLGDMGELGDESEFMHQKAGEIAKQFGVTRLFGLGEFTKHSVNVFGSGAKHFTSHEEIANALQNELTKGVCVLVKGSRAMRLEKIVAAIKGTQSNSDNKEQSDKDNDHPSIRHNKHVA